MQGRTSAILPILEAIGDQNVALLPMYRQGFVKFFVANAGKLAIVAKNYLLKIAGIFANSSKLLRFQPASNHPI